MNFQKYSFPTKGILNLGNKNKFFLYIQETEFQSSN